MLWRCSENELGPIRLVLMVVRRTLILSENWHRQTDGSPGGQHEMTAFLDSLFESGELYVPRPDQTGTPAFLGDGPSSPGIAGVESANVSEQTRTQGTVRKVPGRWEQIWRMQCPGDAPQFSVEVADGAAQVALAISQAIVYRETEIEETMRVIVGAGFALDGLIDECPSAHYSVDLVFRFLPQLLERAERVSVDDPLADLIIRLLRRWPLSSVGVQRIQLTEVPSPLRHPSLWRMYIDRIIQRRDVSRLVCREVSDAVAAAAGPFDLLPKEFQTRETQFPPQ